MCELSELFARGLGLMRRAVDSEERRCGKRRRRKEVGVGLTDGHAGPVRSGRVRSSSCAAVRIALVVSETGGLVRCANVRSDVEVLNGPSRRDGQRRRGGLSVPMNHLPASFCSVPALARATHSSWPVAPPFCPPVQPRRWHAIPPSNAYSSRSPPSTVPAQLRRRLSHSRAKRSSTYRFGLKS